MHPQDMLSHVCAPFEQVPSLWAMACPISAPV